MQRLSASVVCVLLAISLVIASLPLTAAPAPIPSESAAACCGCCAAADTTPDAVAKSACCSSAGPHTDDQNSDEPEPGKSCGSDCGQCPCCPAIVPVMLAILATTGQFLEPAHVAEVVTDSDLLSTRSEEPLLPPPRD
jgi:hypothetical protein